MNHNSKYELINLGPKINIDNQRHRNTIKFVAYAFLVMFFIFISLKIDEFMSILKRIKYKIEKCNCNNYKSNSGYNCNNYNSFKSIINQFDYKNDIRDNYSERRKFFNYKKQLLENISKTKKMKVTKINTLILIHYSNLV